MLSRYGGEEFAILIRGAAADDPMVIAERLRRKISDSPILVDEARWVDVTISVGTATYPLHGTTPAELVTAADRALYAAKVHGRNRTDVDPGNAVTTAELAGTAGMIAYLQHVADVVDGWLFGHEHSRAVSRWAGLTALALGLNGEQVHHATLAGQLHDVGKILVLKEAWTKHTQLSERDRQLVQHHPEHGYQMLRVVAGLSTAAEVVRQHHERVDGTGYPNHLKGEQIRIEARIVAVCDTWAELLADGPNYTEEQAREELQRRRGTQLDPTVVDTFLALHNAGRLGNLSRLPTPTGSR